VTSPFITGILLASGEGRRFGDNLPKQFHHLSGKKLYLYALDAFLKVKKFQEILIIAHEHWIPTILEDIKSLSDISIRVIRGGSTRQESSYLALKACNPMTSHVVIHDAVRPFVSEKILLDNITLALNYEACDTCIPSHDTLVHSKDLDTIESIPLRSHYLRGQTPQSFSYSLITVAHEKALQENIFDATDDCQLVLRLQYPVKIAEGSHENIKVTTELDLLLAEQLLRLKLCELPSYQENKLDGKVFAITGATGGIGQELTKHLSAKGAIVLPISRTATYQADLTSEEATRHVFSKIFDQHGPIDGLINAHGYLKVENLDALTKEEIEKLIHTNFTSLVYACKYCRIKTGGHILNLSSSSYTRGRPSYMIYSGMKAAVVNFTQGLALEYPHLQINSIIPKRANTAMRRENFPQENPSLLLSPAFIAEEILKALHTQNLTGMIFEIKN
jgi:ribitol-5-phosphate 2-dehydrogenase (NADP+) / D-ribitol-5-phosphate cytidylyltransferase